MQTRTILGMEGDSLDEKHKSVKRTLLIYYDMRIFWWKAAFSSFKTTVKQPLNGEKLDVEYLFDFG